MPSNPKGQRIEPGIWRQKDGKGYIVEINYRDPQTGKRIREMKTINRLDLAREWRQTRKADALRGEIRREKKLVPIPFDRFADEYLTAWGLDRKASTAARERDRLEGIFKPYFGQKPIHMITRKDIEEFLRKRRDGSITLATKRRANGISTATANRELCRLRNMFKMAIAWGYLEVNPAGGIKQAREQVAEATFLTREEVAHFLNACDPCIRPVMITAVYTGMRLGELMALEWRDIDFDRKLITVREPKNRELRHVPMADPVREALDAHRLQQAQQSGGIVAQVFINPRTGRPWKEMRGFLSRALQKAGITRHVRFHDLRHTAASHLIMAGVDLRTAGKILGHKTAQMTLRYAHLAPDYLQSAVNKLNFSTAKDVYQRYEA